MDWTEKYRPESLSDIRGNNNARDAFDEWARTWDDHKQAVIIYGAPGVGKTSAAHALANDMGWDVIELNASDQRTASVINKVAGEAAKSGTLTGGGSGKKLVVLDEADNIHGNYDRGGAGAITELVKEASQPMVLIANEFYDMSNGLRNACEDIEFDDVGKRSIKPALASICEAEGIECEDGALLALAEKNDGDLRSAINDLQAIAETDSVLTEDDVVTGSRNRKDNIFEFLDLLIKEEDAEGAREASFRVDETPNDLINWIDDNLPKDYSGAELGDAYTFLSNADKWLGRVNATQNYKYWRYAADNMTSGVAASRRGSKGGWTRFGPPSYWRKLGSSRGKRDRRDYIAQKIAEQSGISMATARNEVMPFLAVMTHHCKNRGLTVEMAAMYELDAEHISFITGSGKDTNKVGRIVEDAEKRRAESAVANSGGAFEGSLQGIEQDADTESSHEGDGADDDQMDFTQQFAADDDNDDEAMFADDTDADDSDSSSDDSQSGLGDFMN